MVDRDPVVLVALDVLTRQGLGDDLADPAVREPFLDRLRVTTVEVCLRQPVDGARHRAARQGVRLARFCRVVAVDDRQCLQHVFDRLDPCVGPALPLVLAPVVVDVAEAALFFRAEVLAEPQHGQVDQVAPLDRRGCLHHGLAVRKRVAVVLRHRWQAGVRDRPALEHQLQRARLSAGDAVRRGRVDANRDDRASQRVRPAGERELLRRSPLRRLTELRQRLLVEREDEVRLRLDLTVEVVGQRGVVERDPRAQQILLQHRLGRDIRKAGHQIFDEPGARGESRFAHVTNLTVGAELRREP